MSRPDIKLTNSEGTCTIDVKQEFIYKPFLPKKRSYTKETNKAIFIQRQTPNFLTGEISFSGKVNKDTGDCLLQMHRACETVTFEGQYGETYGVDFMLEDLEYMYDHAKIKGKMIVLCEIEETEPQCD